MTKEINFERSKEVDEALEAITDKANAAEYGHIFSFAELESLANMDRVKIYSLIRRTNNALLQHNRMLISVPKVGYKVATPQEHNEHVRHRIGKGRRQFRWGKRESEQVPIEKLTPQDIALHAANSAILHNTLAAATKRTERGITFTKKSLAEQEAALSRIESMQTQLDDMRARYLSKKGEAA